MLSVELFRRSQVKMADVTKQLVTVMLLVLTFIYSGFAQDVFFPEQVGGNRMRAYIRQKDLTRTGVSADLIGAGSSVDISRTDNSASMRRTNHYTDTRIVSSTDIIGTNDYRETDSSTEAPIVVDRTIIDTKCNNGVKIRNKCRQVVDFNN
ncbi:unnamed protein product [Acanthoscelides obtectus]|uniref:Uncharacterized protein n=1 Tax=Acanthoscelides obtectus TaxID=200917 RepID=A0A9P0KCJ1_ACAOB|nr:unnamed protein product [Acanthoscelides obtectus]CAK1646782.1 hypothetical protein AOBTE_LOCUS14861 [Acanthoscelides obtectus]